MKKRDPATKDRAAKVALVQRAQLDEHDSQQDALGEHTDNLIDDSAKQSEAIDEIESSVSDLWQEINRDRPSQAALHNAKPLAKLKLDQVDHARIDKAVESLDFSETLLRYDGDWAKYVGDVEEYARSNGIDLARARPFNVLLTGRQRREILERIETDFDEKCDCDRWDYAIAAVSGVIAGLVDAFLVGAPGESLLGGLSDKGADRLVERAAKAMGWQGPKENADPTRSAIGFLERKFRVNYDHRHTGDVRGKFKMSASNHHIKSLAHSPSPIGLLFSILDQFTGSASFVADGRLIRIRSDFTLEGSNVPSKLFAALYNWIGHILSDMAGASGSKERGSGVPIPFFELLQYAKFGSFGKDKKTFADLAVKMFEDGYDLRFGAALAMPVLINELLIRILWVVKRRYYHGDEWSDCRPSANKPNLRRMLLVGHGCLVLVDSADAGVRGGGQPVAMLVQHMNLVAWVRFAYLGLREAYALVSRDAVRMRRIDEAIEAEMTTVLAASGVHSR